MPCPLELELERSIPASAGEPTAPQGEDPAFPVYPRECGGTIIHNVICEPLLGLSPRVRGNRSGALERRLPARSIPASAGEPNATPVPRLYRGVYPRECGGTLAADVQAVEAPGLSPRVRGNLVWPSTVASSIGSIPASAGEPRPLFPGAKSARVYPRECGGTALA